MSKEEVLMEIQRLSSNGLGLKKKAVKQNNPQLMRHALHYFPSWDNAVETSSNVH